MSDETQGLASPPAEGVKPEPINLEAPEKTEPEQKPADEVVQKADGDEAGSEDKGEGEEQQEKKRKLPGSAKAKIRETVLRNENAELLRRLEAFEAGRRQAADPADQVPKEEDFKGDYFAFERAMQAYNVRKVFREERAREVQEQHQFRQIEARRELEISHSERVAEALDPESERFIADYADVMGKMKGVNISQEVADAIIESEKSDLIAYHLASNAEKLRELNTMSGRQLAREIGRLEGSVRRPAAKTQTTAPAPLAQLKGGASAPFDPAKADMEAYAADFRKRLKAKER